MRTTTHTPTRIPIGTEHVTPPTAVPTMVPRQTHRRLFMITSTHDFRTLRPTHAVGTICCAASKLAKHKAVKRSA